MRTTNERQGDDPPLLTLEALLASVAERPDPRKLLTHFVPPPRFEEKDFSNYAPRHPTQSAASARLSQLAAELGSVKGRPPASIAGRLIERWNPRRTVGGRGRGIYLDGGFGVGKTHLLAALWNAGPTPKFYLSFDELMYFIGLMGTQPAAEAFREARLIAVDEWELDDPGNLKLALAFIRSTIGNGACLAVTSNTLPLELGAGRFSQKDFAAEVDELAAVFEVLRVEGDDYRQRHFGVAEAVVGGTGADDSELPKGTLRTSFSELMMGLAAVHPSRFREVVAPIELLDLDGIDPIPGLADALRWVHFIDSVYVNRTRLRTRSKVRPGELFTEDAKTGPFGKKLLRCVSRLQELLDEGGRAG